MNDKRFQRKLDKIKKHGEQHKQIKELEDSYGEYFPAKKTRKVSNIMLVIVVIAIVAYAIADFWLQYKVGFEVSPTLTTCWYSFFGAEIFVLAGIKVSKVVKGSDNDAAG